MLPPFEMSSASGLTESLSCRSVGIDLGAYNSKASVAFKVAELQGDVTQLHRVPAELDQKHAHYSRQTHGTFELPAVAAIADDGTILVGGAAEKKPETFPLKVALMVLAGVTLRDDDEELLLGKRCFLFVSHIKHVVVLVGLNENAGAEIILAALNSRRVTRKDLREAVRDHLQTLKGITTTLAEQSHVEITRIVLTYPNFLCGRGTPGDIDKYLGLYKKLIREIWPEVEAISTVSEGQAAACYVTKPFRDPTFASTRPGHRRLFAQSNVRSGLNILVADGGSSSLNLQVQNIYFDDNDNVICSQSSVGRDWLEGTVHTCGAAETTANPNRHKGRQPRFKP